MLIACTEKTEVLSPIQEIEGAHHKSEFLAKKSISFDLKLYFGGKERVNGKVHLATTSTHGAIITQSDTILFNKGKVYYSNPTSSSKRVRFDAYTWSYFFLLPYKLSDPGTVLSANSQTELNNTIFNLQKLSFKNGVGDAPDDWYLLYSDTKSHLLNTAAYIVTFSKDKVQAEEDPHAIKYMNYNDVSGIPIAKRWEFYSWDKQNGLTDQLGYAELSNFTFDSNLEAFQTPPSHFLEATLD